MDAAAVNSCWSSNLNHPDSYTSLFYSLSSPISLDLATYARLQYLREVLKYTAWINEATFFLLISEADVSYIE